MDTKNLSIAIICLFSIICLSLQADYCPAFTCGNLPKGDCSQKKVDNTTQIASFTLQECQISNSQCPFYNLDVEDTLKCEEKSSVLIRLYPGGPCETDNDCMGNLCKDGTCFGAAENEKCKKDSECYYGFSCRKNGLPDDENTYCLPQKKEGDSCENDFECVNSHGCYKKQCVPYFSLKDGTPIEVYPPVALSLCESGFEYENVCARFTLTNGKEAECDDTKACTYTNYDGKSVSIPEHCLCGYNPFGKKFCLLGNGHQEYVKYVDDVKNLLADTSVCNTKERGVCNHNKKLQNKHNMMLIGNYTNSQILAEHSHELIGSDKCVIKVAYPEYIPDTPEPPTPPEPEVNTCARYTCKRSQKLCAHSHFENNITNVLLSDICDSKSYCNIGGEPNDVFYKKEDVSGTCALKKPVEEGVRYPGEDCNDDKQCWIPVKYPEEKLVGTCKNGKCQGYGRNEACKETAWCKIGLYCGDEEKCVLLLKENAVCTKTTQCQNHLQCFEGKCQNKWFSQPAGTDVKGKGDLPLPYYCSFGKVSQEGKCDYLNNTDIVDTKSELVKCNIGDECNYETVDGPIKKKCECGYNENGLSYCLKGNNYSTDKWVRLHLWRAKSTNNQCHSENRLTCHKNDETVLTSILDYEHQTEKAHLFYGSPDCVVKVLSSSFIKFSLVGLFAILMAILI